MKYIQLHENYQDKYKSSDMTQTVIHEKCHDTSNLHAKFRTPKFSTFFRCVPRCQMKSAKWLLYTSCSAFTYILCTTNDYLSLWQLNKYSGVFAIAQRKGVTVKAEKARKGLSAATFSNTQHICNSFCRINQTNWLPANTLIGLTNCEIEEKVEGNFWGQLGSWSSPFVANESLEMMKSRKSQRILRHIQGNEG